MANASTKQLVERVLADLPDDATVEDVQYGIYVAELVARRSAALDKATRQGVEAAISTGEAMPHDQVVQRFTTTTTAPAPRPSR